MASFWTNRTILITGAGGFIGSHLVEEMLAAGAKVRALRHYNGQGHFAWLKGIKHAHLEVHLGDVRDQNQMLHLCKGIDTIFHLAALIGIPYSYHSPQSYLDTNVSGTLNLSLAARQQDCRRLILMSTSEVYGTAQQIPISEQHPFAPQSPYSASKISGDAIALSQYFSFALPLTIVRPFNNYGPRQSARAIIPTIITQLLSGAKELKLGDLRPTRDFVFVKDTVKAIRHLAERDAAIGQSVNICTGQEHSMQDVVNHILSLMEKEIPVVQESARLRPVNSEVQRLLGDASLLRQLIDWTPETSLQDGLAQSIAWFRTNHQLINGPPDRYQI
ncbi:MAG: GDP-mannose 4,6-dehydratase [Bacteroidota bacterium]